MKLIYSAIMMGAFLAPDAVAQGARAPAGGAGGFRGFGSPRLGTMPHFGRPAVHHSRTFPSGPGAFPAGGWAVPALYSDFGQLGCRDDAYSMPVVAVVAQPPQAPAPAPPPPEPARPTMQTYNWPSDANDAASTFSIVRGDGTIHAAIATWVQDGVLHHTGPNGITEHTPLDNVDREATRRLNARNELNLRSPAEPPVLQSQSEPGVRSGVEQSTRGGK